MVQWPIPVAARSETKGRGRSFAGIAGSNRGHGCLSFVNIVLSGRGHCGGPICRPGEPCRVCVCVSLSVIRRNNNPLHLQWLGRRSPTKKEIRHAMYMWRNTEVHSRNHWCSGKVISITYSEGVFVTLGIQHVQRMRHIVTCGLPRCKIFFQIIWQTARFSRKSYRTQNVCFGFL